jgi:hypothetical protein
MISDNYIDIIDYYIAEANSPLGLIKFCYDLNKNSVIGRLYENKKRDNSWVVLFVDLSGIAIIFYENYYAVFKLIVDDLEGFLKYFDLWEVIYSVDN